MSSNTLLEKALELSQTDRIRLVEEIWDSLASEPDDLQLSDALKKELDARLETFHKDPTAGSSWEDVKARILKLA